VLLAAGVAAAALGTGPATQAQSPITTLTTGLNSPRGLNFTALGELVVVEAGDGSAACEAGRNTLSLPPRNVPICVSRTGAVSQRYSSGEWARPQVNWPSWRSNVPGQAFAEVTGPQDISFPFRGRAFITVGWGGTPETRREAPARGRSFGLLLKSGPDDKRTAWADIAGYEQAWNPAGGPVDSNPYGILAEKGRTYVVDAGANALYRVQGKWNVSLVTTFPRTTNPADCRIPVAPGVVGPPAPPSSEPVPTTVARGPDGALYVGELTGFPFCAGAARIWKVVEGEEPTPFLTGFKSIIDMAFARDGTLYVLQYASSPSGLGGPGQIVKVAPNGTRTVLQTGTTLQQPAGVAIGPSDGTLYVTNKTITPGGGEVLRIVP
jgi:hypothetical protein